MKNILSILFLLTSFYLFSFDTTTDVSADYWKNRSEIFRKSALAKDIAFADLNQLKSMAMALGLKEEDNAATYRNALINYYNIKLFESKQKKGEKIVLERAGELKMLKIKEEDEENLHLIGKVRMLLSSTDEKKQSVQRIIEADDVYIDLKNKEITGVGNVYFKDDNLEFNGEQFYFNFEVNRGVLFGGRTKILKSGDSGLKDAYFTGDKIVQAENDDAILHNGNLTTCDEEKPHYYIKVSKIWISQKGEWGLLNGVIYIGPIPFFYIPIYYHPKDLMISPVFGYRSREGWFLQTTYFLLGDKTTEDFMGKDKIRTAPSGENALFRITKAMSDQKLNEFYDKYDFYKKNPKFRILPKFNSIDFALRFSGDAYTTLGFYTGLFYYMKVDHQTFPFTMTFLSDIAFSRTLWKNPDADNYLPYNPADKGKPLTSKNTYFHPEENPLLPRFSEYLNFTGQINNSFVSFNYDGQLEYLPDENYFKDFYNRRLSFSYIDLAFDGLKYNIESQNKKFSNFEVKKDTTVSTGTPPLNKINITFSPKNIPKIFNLPLISSISLKTTSSLSFLAVAIKSYAPTTDNSTKDDPRYRRYFFQDFTAPELEYSMSGTLINYEFLVNLPKNIKDNKKKPQNKEDDIIKNLYLTVNTIKNTDPSKDAVELDYKNLFMFFGKKNVITPKKVDNNTYKFNDIILSSEDDYTYKKEEKVEDVTKTSTKKEYNFSSPQIIETEQKDTYKLNIKIIDFGIDYSFSNKLSNKFIFNTDTSIDSPSDLDSIQRFLGNKFETNKNVKRLNITDLLSFSVKGYLKMFMIQDKPLFQVSPELTINYNKDFDVMDIYRSFLKFKYNVTDDNYILVKNEINNLERNTNKKNSKLDINYTGNITNDLSFNNDFINGTNISTSLSFNLFEFNEFKKDIFNTLNSKNANTKDYEPVNTDLYSTRVDYDKIKALSTTFNLKLNLIPKGSDHLLSVGVSPTINWRIPDSNLTEMKNEVWNENTTDVIYDKTITDEEIVAREYIYYRKNKSNLRDKIASFYYKENFWEGPRNFRNMFQDVTINFNYDYKKNNISVVSINNQLVFKLKNIGNFFTGDNTTDNAKRIFSIYPDDNFSLNFLGGVISYTMNLTFINELYYDFNYPSISAKEKLLDDYRIITLNNRHTFNLRLAGTLFEVKLPKGDWLNFSTSLEFLWNRNKKWLNNKIANNNFYLNSQTLTMSILMDIFKVSLNFKAIDFKDVGYGFRLDSGNLTLGYNVTEIPVFWTYFKLYVNPSIVYNFAVKHDGDLSSQFNSSSYYANNSLAVSFSTDLVIGEKTSFETRFHFETRSENKEMYKYYTGTDGLRLFFEDIFKSFNFAKIEDRTSSPFKLKNIVFWVEHNLHDWKLRFEYSGRPEVNTNTKRYYWENTFKFLIEWKLDSKNQLIKMFNKTKVNSIYEKGEWKQPLLSLDPDKN
ncbi:MAG: hypothetical protein A2086_11795 [Spirochaetes bacterium GWD1_27_9]|nr:MAG: hypothetical protein A2Z98_07255 [Spirochaetes bacterium GWB1_27_13]OHD28642.1 MAG: hypothetical protein A2086_11795 [Spirochaetes bacterium GWD1_27_9]